MSTTLDLPTFIKVVVNKCSIVKSTRLDKTIKALINYYLYNSSLYNKELVITYLNKIRVIYYLKRLDYFNKEKSLEYKGKLKLNYLELI